MPKTKSKRTPDPLQEEKSKLTDERKVLTGKDKLNVQEQKRLELINARLAAIKSEKFVSLAQKRTVRAINAIRGLQRLTNKAAYSWTDGQANKICEALKAEVLDLNNRFKGQAKQDEGFSLAESESE